MSREVIRTDKAPQAIGPYSQAVGFGNLLFCSGQIPLRPDGSLEQGDISAQTRQVLTNVKGLLEASGSGLEHNPGVRAGGLRGYGWHPSSFPDGRRGQLAERGCLHPGSASQRLQYAAESRRHSHRTRDAGRGGI